MEKAIVPKEVAKALDLHMEAWKNQTTTTQLLQFMALPYTGLKTPVAATLINFAVKDPVTYMHAVLHGYEPRIENASDLADVIEIWVAKPYDGDNERKDIERLAGTITKHFQL